MKPIIVKPQARIRELEIENARLRALVGEAAPVEPVEGEEQQSAPTLVEKTSALEESALDLAELQSEMLYQLCLMEMG